MTRDLEKVDTPEESELTKKKAELKRLSNALAEKELSLAELKHNLVQFQRRYYARVGHKYVELDELRAQIAELLARQKPHDSELDEFATRARAQAKHATEEYEGVDINAQVGSQEPKIIEEAKKLYRSIASIIHPDKSTDEKSRDVRTRLMAELNESYEQSDITSMKRILSKWHESPESIAGEGTASDLVRIIREIAQMKRRIAEIKSELAKLKKSELYVLMTRVNEAESVGKDILAEMSSSVETQIQDAQRELASLKG